MLNLRAIPIFAQYCIEKGLTALDVPYDTEQHIRITSGELIYDFLYSLGCNDDIDRCTQEGSLTICTKVDVVIIIYDCKQALHHVYNRKSTFIELKTLT